MIRLNEGLEIIAVFDRLDDYPAEANQGDGDTRQSRQRRRSEILTEIARLKARKLWFEKSYARAGAVLLLLIFANLAVY